MGNVYYAQGLPRIYAQLAPNLKALYDMSEGTGTKVYNMVQNTFHGTLNAGASGNTLEQMWGNGNPGGVDFDAVNDRILFGDLFYTYVDYNKNWSWESWYLWDSSTYEWGPGQTKVAASQGIWSQYYNNSGFYRPTIYMYQGGGKDHYCYGTGTVPVTQPAHIVITYANSARNATDIKIYINGVEPTYTRNSVTAMNGSIYLGYTRVETEICGAYGSGYAPGGGKHMKFALYDKTLNSTEVTTLFNIERQFVR
jgi:hypothetical protein